MKTSKEYWTDQLNYCVKLLNELPDNASKNEKTALLDCIAEATEALKSISDGTYKSPTLGFLLLEINE